MILPSWLWRILRSNGFKRLLIWGAWSALVAVVLFYAGVNLWGKKAWEDAVEELNARGYPSTIREALRAPSGEATDVQELAVVADEIQRIERDDDPLMDVADLGLSDVRDDGFIEPVGGATIADPSVYFDEVMKPRDAGERLLALMEPYEARRRSIIELQPERVLLFNGRDEGVGLMDFTFGLAEFFRGHALISSAAGRSDLFGEDVLTMMRWNLAEQRTPQTLMGRVIGLGNQILVCELIKEGLMEGSFTDEHLALVSENLAEMDPIESMLLAMEIEVSGIIESYPLMNDCLPKLDFDLWIEDWKLDREVITRKWMSLVYALGPKGVHLKGYADMLKGLENELRMKNGEARDALSLEDIRRYERNAASRPTGFDLEETFLNPPYGESHWDWLESVTGHALKVEAEVRMARVAVAFELERRWRGGFPKDLSELDVGIKDPFSGSDLGYRLEPDGGFTLWSVGRDGVDDGGGNGDRTFRFWIRKP